VREQAQAFCPREEHPSKWNVTQLANEVLNQFGIDLKAVGVEPAQLSHDEVEDTLGEKVKQRYEEKEQLFGAPTMRWLERRIVLDIVDSQWKDHLYSLDHLKEGIGLRG